MPEKFGELGVNYVIQALLKGRELKREEYHSLEMPIANLACLTANINRDTKRQRKPYQVKDFYFFSSKDADNAPDAEPAAAYMALLKSGELPTWTLSIYADMKHGEPEAAPDPVAAFGEHVLILAPKEVNGGLEGLLLASGEAFGQHVKVKLGRRRLTLAIPEFDGSFVAREGVYLPQMS